MATLRTDATQRPARRPGLWDQTAPSFRPLPRLPILWLSSHQQSVINPRHPVSREYTNVVRQSNVDNKRRRGRASLMRVRTWPVAAKLVGLCVGIAASVAVGLTVLGYTQASAGLKQEAEAALWSDGLLVANQVDAWNLKRSSDVQALAALPAVQRVLVAGPDALPVDVQ